MWPQPAACSWWYTCERCSKLCQALSSIIMPTVARTPAPVHWGRYNVNDTLTFYFTLSTASAWSIACHRCSCTAGILQVPGYCSFQSGLLTSLHVVTIQGEVWHEMGVWLWPQNDKSLIFWFSAEYVKWYNMNLKHWWNNCLIVLKKYSLSVTLI